MGWEDLVAVLLGMIAGHLIVRFVRRYKKWAVVQDLRPFGYRIERLYFREYAAMRFASKSMYLSVLPHAFAKEENKRLKELLVYPDGPKDSDNG